MEDDKALVEEGEIHEEENDVEKDDKEDIPDNFFDDFNNEGFMESLQIVDSLDDTNPTEEVGGNNEERIEVEQEETPEISRERKRSKKYEGGRRRSRSRERKNRGSPHRKRKFDDTALRRDPNKTKRDLERDRENFFKKKEQKVISKIVETGLVPPGMESEASLNVIVSEKNQKVEEEAKRKLKENNPSRERRSALSKEKNRRRSRSRSYGKYSPRFRSRSRGFRRDKRRSLEKRMRSRSGERGRLYEPYSPPPRRRRSRSISDRERWLKQSRSPERKYQGKVREKRMSFLEEIKMKLNGDIKLNGEGFGGDMVTYPFPKNPVQPNMYQDVPPQYGQGYVMVNAPPMSATYNEDFFIGDQSVAAPLPQMMPVDHNLGVVDPMAPMYGGSVAPVPPPPDTSEISAKVSQLMARISASTSSGYDQSGNPPQASHLSSPCVQTDFPSIQPAEKQWPVSDFPPNNPAAEHSSDGEALKKKVDVLSRCQDFLKEISGDKKTNGKLKVTKSNRPQSKHEQNVSPLLRQKPLKFSFNTQTTDNNYQDVLARALIKTGLVSEIIDLVEEDGEPLPPPAPNLAKKRAPIKPEMSMKMCQTDPVKCEECEQRKRVQLRSVGTQCGESERYNVGVQVVEEDILNFRISKNQSLAHMTPAQLLGRSDPVSSRAENFSDPRGMQPSYREPGWGRPRDFYVEPPRDYQGPPYYGGVRDPRYPPRY